MCPQLASKKSPRNGQPGGCENDIHDARVCEGARPDPLQPASRSSSRSSSLMSDLEVASRTTEEEKESVFLPQWVLCRMYCIDFSSDGPSSCRRWLAAGGTQTGLSCLSTPPPLPPSPRQQRMAFSFPPKSALQGKKSIQHCAEQTGE